MKVKDVIKMMVIALLGGLSMQSASANVLYSVVGITSEAGEEPDMVVTLDYLRPEPNENTPLATDLGSTEVMESAQFVNITDLTSDTREGQFRLFASNSDPGQSTLLHNQLLEVNTNPVLGPGEERVMVIGNFGIELSSLAFDRVTGALYGVSTSSVLQIIDIDPMAIDPGNATAIGSDVGHDAILSLAFDNYGDLYGVNALTNELLLIDTITGVGTVVANLELSAVFDIVFDSDNNDMYVLSGFDNDGSLHRFDRVENQEGPDTYVDTLIDTYTPYNGKFMNGLAFGEGPGGVDGGGDPDPTPIPEPGTLALLGPAMIALMRRKRK